jgi:hypothetical protein
MNYVLYLVCLSPVLITALIFYSSKFDFPQKKWFALTAIFLSYLGILAVTTLILIPAQLLTALFLPVDLSLSLQPPLAYWFPVVSFVALHDLWITSGLALLSSYWIHKYLANDWVRSFRVVESYE